MLAIGVRSPQSKLNKIQYPGHVNKGFSVYVHSEQGHHQKNRDLTF